MVEFLVINYIFQKHIQKI